MLLLVREDPFEQEAAARVVILEAEDGSTVIWVLDDPDQLSFSSDTDGWA